MINGRKLKDKGNPWPGGGTGEINIIKYIIAAMDGQARLAFIQNKGKQEQNLNFRRTNKIV